MVWLLPEDRDRAADEAEVRIGSKFLNDRGSDRIKGNHEASRWVCLSGLVDGKPAGITVLCHQENLRSPQKARLHPTKPYFCFTPCVDEPIVIDQQHPLVSKYRYLITDSVPDPEWINRQWMSWNEAVDSN